MAGFGYTYRGGYTTYSGLAPRADGWTRTSYNSDQVSQPLIIDAEGRRKPIITYPSNGSTECYVTKTEIVEHIPLISGYKQTTPVRVEVLRDYTDVEDKWNKPSSPVRYHVEEKWNRPSSPEKWRRPSSPVSYHGKEKWNRLPSPDKWRRPSSPVRHHGEEKWKRPSSPVRHHGEEKWNRPSSPVRLHGEEKWNRPSSPVHDRPQQVEDFITKVQTEASRPNKSGPLGATYWRQMPGYGDHQSDHLSKDERKNKPSHGAWSTPQGAHLGKPTNDLNAAVEYLKEAVKPAPRYAHGYSETIDNKEAARRYGNMSLAARPKDSYATTIDSREAARKYGGTTV